MASVTIKGLDKLTKQLADIPKATMEGAQKANHATTEEIASRAISNLQSSTRHSSGAGGLAGEIKNESETIDGTPEGRVWVDSPIGTYREFGTGPVGEASQKDLPDGVNPVYTQDPWLIPADKVGADLNALYGLPIWTIKGKKYYWTRGQPARPFLYPAFKEVVADTQKWYEQEINKELKKVVK